MTDAALVAGFMREADKRELAAIGQSPLWGAVSSIDASKRAWVGKVRGVPICIFGVSEWPDGTGRPWMLGTDELPHNARIFIRRCKSCVKEMRKLYPVLQNYVDVHNVNTIEWLKWLGFEMMEQTPYGVNGEVFWRFQWISDHAA